LVSRKQRASPRRERLQIRRHAARNDSKYGFDETIRGETQQPHTDDCEQRPASAARWTPLRAWQSAQMRA
jgi:hypothetical protein